MNKILARLYASAGLSLLLLIYPGAVPCRSAMPGPASKPHTTRQELIGAWRLVSIQIVGPNGPTIDPFYNADPTGILFYDRSGWMSVQIVGQSRPSMQPPDSRPAGTHTAEAARLEAALLDTYYAYFGTWTLDETTSTVTHHVSSSLFPSEAGMSYSQTVAVAGEILTLTVRREARGSATIQRKIWKRISTLGTPN